MKKKCTVHAKMLVGDNLVTFQIDSGATANLIPLKYVNVEIQNTEKSLQMWNKNDLKPIGSCVLRLKNPKTMKKYKVNFIVVKENLMPIIGKNVSEKMGTNNHKLRSVCGCISKTKFLPRRAIS